MVTTGGHEGKGNPASARRAGEGLIAMVCSAQVLRLLSLILAAVCQNDNACVGFPLPGEVSSLVESSHAGNMTCYKGGETVFNNHQMCNVTSESISILRAL